MADHSLVIRNARIVDGSGAPASQGDLAVTGDRITAVGKVDGRGAREIDAHGHVLAPGFIDIHTHYDPQFCWDRNATPSPEHGVTTVVMGNCSIGLAPLKKQDAPRLIGMFGSVEDMDSDLLKNAVPFTWETYDDYVRYLKQGLGPNLGVFVGHSALRLYVMGAASQERAATDDEIVKMARVLREAMNAGAFGMSLSYAHLDERGHHLPGHYADRRELEALARVIAAADRGMIQVAPNVFDHDGFNQIDFFGQLSLDTGVSCTLSPTLQTPGNGNVWWKVLMRYEVWRSRGAKLYTQSQVRPLDISVRLSEGSVALSKLASWRHILGLPLAQRIAEFKKPEHREALRNELAGSDFVMGLVAAMTVRKTTAADNAKYVGRRLTDIAAEEKRAVSDVLLDIALRDDLDTMFVLQNVIHADTPAVALLLSYPGLHIGSGDAGAHIQQFAGAGDTCYLFERFVRAEGVMSVERAVQRLTSDIARDWRIKDRGLLQAGKLADLVIFDPDTIVRGEEEWVNDVPGGLGRYVRHPTGIDAVIVNGELLVQDGAYTDAKPGRII